MRRLGGGAVAENVCEPHTVMVRSAHGNPATVQPRPPGNKYHRRLFGGVLHNCVKAAWAGMHSRPDRAAARKT